MVPGGQLNDTPSNGDVRAVAIVESIDVDHGSQPAAAGGFQTTAERQDRADQGLCLCRLRFRGRQARRRREHGSDQPAKE